MAEVSRETHCQGPGCTNELEHAATGRPKHFCSDRCRKRSHRPLSVLAEVCEQCGGPIVGAQRSTRRYCSHSCAARASDRRLAS